MPIKKKESKIAITPMEMAKFMALYMAMKEMEDMMEEDDEDEEDMEECGCSSMKKPKMLKKK